MFGGVGTCRRAVLSCLHEDNSRRLIQSRICPVIGRCAPHALNFTTPIFRKELSWASVLHKKKQNQPRQRTGDFFRDFVFAGEDIHPDDFFLQEELRFENEIHEAGALQEAGGRARNGAEDEAPVGKEGTEGQSGVRAEAQAKKIPKRKSGAEVKKGVSIRRRLVNEEATAATGQENEGAIGAALQGATPIGRTANLEESRKQNQKNEISKKQLQLIRKLRKLTLKPPKMLPKTVQQLYVTKLRTNDFSGAIQGLAKLSPEEKQALEDCAAQNAKTNAKVLREWILSLTPLQVKQANSARRKLRKLLGKSRVWLLHDDRTVTRPLDSWKVFLKEKNNTRGANESVLEMTHRISQEWRSFTPEQKEKYERIAHEDFERYLKEYREVYGEEPPKGTGRMRKYHKGKKTSSKGDDQPTTSSEST
ncbi:hypothetical protein KEM54_004853 [Ascosphaera aggregata]|nr:hypothetical protein KEM54_004853 [Ascosphaera aggregata]